MHERAPDVAGLRREPTQEDPLTGTPYRLVRALGRGGLGEVIEAEHETLGHRVAIKLLHPEYFASFENKERMRLEAQACARIRHDHLVPVHDFGETTDGRVFLVMELLRGRSLAEELRVRGHLPVAEAIDIARQALSGLAAAHAAAIVHRDIKPDNLFLSEAPDGSRRVKVLDFGLAKIMGRASPLTPAPLAQPTADGMTVGTARWSSPEQSRGDPDIDARSDLYSMGWVLYAMLTGSEPFPNLRTNRELFAAHSADVPAPPFSLARQPIPAALDAIVMRAIAKRREDRFASADAFRAALDGLGSASASATLVATIEQAPMMALHAADRTVEATVEASEAAIARPVLPWAQPVRRTPSRRRAARLPLWFVAVVAVGVGGTVLAAVLYVWAG